MMKLIILRGLPGSGKSTLKKRLSTDIKFCGRSFSTDTYWERPDGIYDFNINLLHKAHQWNFDCFKEFVEACNNTKQTIILDNTNTTYKEFKNYIKLFCEVNDEPEIILMEPTTEWAKNVQVCYERGTHGVPITTIKSMLIRWEESEEIKSKIEQDFKHATVEIL